MELLNAENLVGALVGLHNQRSEEKQWTPEQWNKALTGSAQEFAQDILKNVELPLVTGVTTYAGSNQVCIEMESPQARYTINIEARRKMDA